MYDLDKKSYSLNYSDGRVAVALGAEKMVLIT
jgi:hypothetical protein